MLQFINRVKQIFLSDGGHSVSCLIDGSDDILADGVDENPFFPGLWSQDFAFFDFVSLLEASKVPECGVANPHLLDEIGRVLVIAFNSA